MSYKDMWNNLKKEVDLSLRQEKDNTSKIIYEKICSIINALEEKNIRGTYICIKDNGSIKEGMECNIVDQNEKELTVEWINNPFDIINFVSYEEFNEYFKRRKNHE